MEKILTIKNEKGMHIRPAGEFVKMASRFKSKVEIEYKNKRVNGKSVMILMSLGMTKGSQIKLIVTGEDEAEAIKALSEFVDSGFGEM